MYDLLFITTFQNTDCIYKLLDSLNNNKSISLFVLLISQDKSFKVFANDCDYDYEILNIGRTSLSNARNVGVEFILNKGIRSRYFMFPDDDSTYSKEFFDNFNNSVFGDNYLIDVYCEGSFVLYRQNKILHNKLLKENDYELAMSVNLLVNQNTFLKINYFDEDLGVGAKYGSSEDVDYFLRIIKSNERFYYNKKLYNYHPSPMLKYKRMTVDELIKRYVKYSIGIVYSLCKNKLYFMIFKTIIYGFIGSIYAFLHLDLKLFVARFISSFIRIFFFVKFFFKK